MLHAIPRRRRRQHHARHPRPVLYLAERCEPRTLLTAIASDHTLAGTIATAGQVDSYTFAATAGQSIYAAVAETVPGSALSVSVALRAPDNTLLDSAASATGTNVFVTNVTQTGTFTLTVTGLSNTTGAYAITLALPGSAPAPGTDAGPIASAAYRTATIDPGDLDVHTINGTAGGSLLATIGETVTSGFDPEISIYSPSGTFLNSAASATGTVLLIQNLPATGTYYVVAADQLNDETGAYGLTVATFGGTQTSDADSGPVNSGERHVGSIDPGDFDVYTLQANAAGSLLAALGETLTSGFDPNLLIFSPAGAVLANTAAAAGTGSLLTNLPATGTYYAVVLDQLADETGSYALSLARFGGSQSTTPGDEDAPLTSGDYRTGLVSTGDFDVYTLAASAGNTLVASLGDLDPSGGLDPQLLVFSPSGAVLNNTAGAAGTTALLPNLPATGTYAIVALDQLFDETGSYGLSAARFGNGAPTPAVNPGDEGGTLTSAQRRLGRIAPGDLDAYAFDLAAGQGAFWTVGETIDDAFTPQLIILGPTGTSIFNSANARGRDAALPNTGAPTAGTYTAVVLDFGGGTPGEYALTGVAVPAAQTTDDDSGPLTAAQPRAGALPPGDADVYTFAATAGQALTFNLAKTNPTTTTLTPALVVYGPTGAIAGSNAGATSASVAIPSAAAGTYTVVVEDLGGDGTGAYSLALNTPAGTDTFPPTLLESAYRYNDRLPTLRLAFSEDVEASFQPEDFQLQNLTTGQTIDPADLVITFTSVTNEIYFGFSALPKAVLPDGNYRLTIPAANLTDPAGNPLAAPLNVDFFVLAGDANHDRFVNFADLLALARNYSGTGKSWSQGDFTYDGFVNFADLLALAKNYSRTLPLPPPPAAPLASPAALTATPTTALATNTPSVLRDDQANRPLFSTTRVAPPTPIAPKPRPAPRPRNR